MAIELDIAPEMQERIAAVTAKTGLTASDLVSDALQNGHSLEWQEQFLEKVAAGIAAADRNDFATEADLERVRNKYRAS